MTGLDGEPSPDMPWTHSRRGTAHRSRSPGKEERCWRMLPAILVSSHARTVPRPASLGSDSTATSMPIVDGRNAEEPHHQFQWATTSCRAAVKVLHLYLFWACFLIVPQVWVWGVLLHSMWWFRWLDHLFPECCILGRQGQILCRPPELGFEEHTSRPCLLPCLVVEWA